MKMNIDIERLAREDPLKLLDGNDSSIKLPIELKIKINE